MKQSTFLVIYKDSPSAFAMYFGPFVDRDHAERFSNGLPEPRTGGFKKYTVTQPFTHEEAAMVSDLIQMQRLKVDGMADKPKGPPSDALKRINKVLEPSFGRKP